MKRTKMLVAVFTMLGVVVAGMAIAAQPVYPSSIAGTYPIIANNSTGTLVINQSSATPSCNVITGTVFGNNIQGYYCPERGNLVFARLDGAGKPFQFYSGNISPPRLCGQGGQGALTMMGGSFAQWDPNGNQGEWQWQVFRSLIC